MTDSYSLSYSFEQNFDFPAKTAYGWCTDYRPDDHSLMGKKGSRKIRRINEDTLILTDTYPGLDKPVTKKRLVRLDPGRLSWTNTHISGPNKHSQFWYRITGVGKGKSKLEFIGHQVYYCKVPPGKSIEKLADELKGEDSGMWRLLAAEMRKDLGQQSHRKHRQGETNG